MSFLLFQFDKNAPPWSTFSKDQCFEKMPLSACLCLQILVPFRDAGCMFSVCSLCRLRRESRHTAGCVFVPACVGFNACHARCGKLLENAKKDLAHVAGGRTVLLLPAFESAVSLHFLPAACHATTTPLGASNSPLSLFQKSNSPHRLLPFPVHEDSPKFSPASP